MNSCLAAVRMQPWNCTLHPGFACSQMQVTPSPRCGTVHALTSAPGRTVVPPRAVMGGTWRIPAQVNVPLFSQARWRARSLCAPACVRVRVCSLSCAKPPRPHGAGSGSGGLHQTKPLCSTPFSQPSAVLPESEPPGLSEHSSFLHQGSPRAARKVPPARLGCPQHRSSATRHCLCAIVRAHSTKAQLN